MSVFRQACKGRRCRALLETGIYEALLRRSPVLSERSPQSRAEGLVCPSRSPGLSLCPGKGHAGGERLCSPPSGWLTRVMQTMAKARHFIHQLRAFAALHPSSHASQNLRGCGRQGLLSAPLRALGRLQWEMLLLSPSSPNCLKTCGRARRSHRGSASQKMGLMGYTETS